MRRVLHQRNTLVSEIFSFISFGLGSNPNHGKGCTLFAVAIDLMPSLNPLAEGGQDCFARAAFEFEHFTNLKPD